MKKPHMLTAILIAFAVVVLGLVIYGYHVSNQVGESIKDYYFNPDGTVRTNENNHPRTPKK